MAKPVKALVLRQDIRITGLVQGIGFRPFIYRLASELKITGHVSNSGGEVHLRIQGEAGLLEKFHQRLRHEKPLLADIRSIDIQPSAATTDCSGFTILPSTDNPFIKRPDSQISCPGQIPPDLAVCSECLKELFQPSDRRYLYPFINCTNCGPRYSIIHQLPYDRMNTSMADFQLCQTCKKEYHAISNRRFHAEPVSCHTCGPTLTFLPTMPEAKHQIPDNPIQRAIETISSGGVISIKGVGGYHLVCDAQQSDPVLRIREIKQRPEKPLAILALNTASASQIAYLTSEAKARIESESRPILLLKKRKRLLSDEPAENVNGSECSGDPVSGLIAPGSDRLGIMLPCMPVHYLLFHAALGNPPNPDWLAQPCPFFFVMTSANKKGQPLLSVDEECLRELSDQVDGFLVHNRQIINPCDDSIELPAAPGSSDQKRQIIRPGRGIAPLKIDLNCEVPSVLACGSFLKNTICVTHKRYAWISPYIGDLDSAANCERFDMEVDVLLNHTGVTPEAVCSDLHPDFWCTRFAENFVKPHNQDYLGLPHFRVQHHHAHTLAVLAEHQSLSEDNQSRNSDEPVLGLILDGFGLGTDSEAWGGELLRVEGTMFRRLAHLEPLPLPGGDIAVRDPWRPAMASLIHAKLPVSHYQHLDKAGLESFLRNVPYDQIPKSSAAGRWFDLAASLLNICHTNQFEAQAAMALEALANSETVTPAGSDTLCQINSVGNLDLWPLIPHLSDCEDAHQGAVWFHQQFISGLLNWVNYWRQRESVNTIVLGGGCFTNQILLLMISNKLQGQGVDILKPYKLPFNDSGLSLGQAWYGCLKL